MLFNSCRNPVHAKVLFVILLAAAFFATSPFMASALINPSIYTDKASDAVLGTVLAVSAQKDASSGTTQVVIILKVTGISRSGPATEIADVITIAYLSDSPALRQAASDYAARPPMPGPQLLTPPLVPKVNARGVFFLKPIGKKGGKFIYEPAAFQYSFRIDPDSVENK